MIEQEQLNEIENKLDIILRVLKEQGCNKSQYIEPQIKQTMLYTYLDEWLNEVKAPKIKPKSLKVLQSGVERYIKPIINDKPLTAVRSSEMLTAIESCPYSYMRQVVYCIFCAVFKRAYQCDLITESPAAKLDFVKHYRNKGRALTSDEQAAFIKALDNEPTRPLWLFYMLSGCRCNEALTLLWQDIDEEQQRIYIRGTKTYYSKRYIPLFPQLSELLAEIPHNNERVFPYTVRVIKLHFDRIRRANGFTFRIHDLRHTFATRCLESGITINTVSKWLGHSSPTTTATIYQHIQIDFERQEVSRFNPHIKPHN
jgi:integrase